MPIKLYRGKIHLGKGSPVLTFVGTNRCESEFGQPVAEFFNPDIEHARSDFDLLHIFNANFINELLSDPARDTLTVRIRSE